MLIKNKKLITDEGVVEKSSVISIVFVVICCLISIGLIYLGIMAWITGTV